MEWIPTSRCGQRPLRWWHELTQDQQKLWRRYRGDPKAGTNIDTDQFFTIARKATGWCCGCCGDEFPLPHVGNDDIPAMLLMVQAGPNAETNTRFYAAVLPRGIEANVIRALKLAATVTTPENQRVFGEMRGPTQQFAADFISRLVEFPDNSNAMAAAALDRALSKQARSGKLVLPRKMRPIVKDWVPHMKIIRERGVTVHEG
ncbi:hypothetical protein N9L68_05115 [bacterium]|nr:hypothetical protein [bacterium]